MKIIINNKYILTSDKHQYILKEIKTNEKGVDFESHVGFYPKREQVFSKLIDLDIHQSNANSLKELSQEIQNKKFEFESIVEQLESEE